MDDMNDMSAEPAVFDAVIEIKRAHTGKVEKYKLTGIPVAEPESEPKQIEKD